MRVVVKVLISEELVESVAGLAQGRAGFVFPSGRSL